MFSRLFLISLSMLGATAASAKVVTLDHEQFDYNGDGNHPPICANENHLNYCAINTYDYSHFAPYAFLSDYDWRATETFTTDPGYVFTPKKFDILFAESNVWRLYCPNGSCIGENSYASDPGRTSENLPSMTTLICLFWATGTTIWLPMRD